MRFQRSTLLWRGRNLALAGIVEASMKFCKIHKTWSCGRQNPDMVNICAIGTAVDGEPWLTSLSDHVSPLYLLETLLPATVPFDMLIDVVAEVRIANMRMH